MIMMIAKKRLSLMETTGASSFVLLIAVYARLVCRVSLSTPFSRQFEGVREPALQDYTRFKLGSLTLSFGGSVDIQAG